MTNFAFPSNIDRSSRPTSVMSEAELIAAHGGLPLERRAPADLIDLREMRQRAVAAAILEAEARLEARVERR